MGRARKGPDMSKPKCWGRSYTTWRRCGRDQPPRGRYCEDHKTQPFQLAFVLVFTVLAGLVSFLSFFRGQVQPTAPAIEEAPVSEEVKEVLREMEGEVGALEARLDELRKEVRFEEGAIREKRRLSTELDGEILESLESLKRVNVATERATAAAEQATQSLEELTAALEERIANLETENSKFRSRLDSAEKVAENRSVESVLDYIETTRADADGQTPRHVVISPEGEPAEVIELKPLDAETRENLVRRAEGFFASYEYTGAFHYASTDCVVGIPKDCTGVELERDRSGSVEKLEMQWFTGPVSPEVEAVLAAMSQEQKNRALASAGGRICGLYRQLEDQLRLS